MEKGPEIRVIGAASPENKEKAKQEKLNAFFNNFASLSEDEQRELKKFEYPKSAEEVALLTYANRETSRLMQEAGVAPYDIPLENFRIVPPELYKRFAKSPGSSAITFQSKQGIFFNAESSRGNPAMFCSHAFHEALHLKAHFSLESEEDKDGKVTTTPYRQGVSIHALQQHGYNGLYHEHFSGLHEALVAEAEKKQWGDMLKLPELAEARTWLETEEAAELKKKAAEKADVTEDEIQWVEKDRWFCHSYVEQRRVLRYVCEEIQKQFSGQFPDTDSVYKAFLSAHFTGRLLSIAQLVEGTFGEGSFRLLGNMDTNSESAILHLETLKKARLRQLRAKAA